MNVLSLFDGIACGRVALERAGINVNRYLASEIDKHAIKIAQKNYPDIEQLGDVTQLDLTQLPKIDLLIGGSPCQGFSKTVSDNINFDHPQSRLFFEYVKILKAIKPKYFLLENVPMKPWCQDVISNFVGCEPIAIDSALVSAQDRLRLYWTNIPGIDQPQDKGLVLKDVMLPSNEVCEKYWYKVPWTFHGHDKKVCATLHIKGHDILKRVNNPNFKSATLTACRGGNLQKKVFQEGGCRKLTPIEYERLQTLTDGYTEGLSDHQRYNTLGDGWTVDVITHIVSHIAKSKEQVA